MDSYNSNDKDLNKLRQYLNFPYYKKLNNKAKQQLQTELSTVRLFNQDSVEIKKFIKILKRECHQEEILSPKAYRAIACFLGLLVADALGLYYEFLPILRNEQGYGVKSFKDCKPLNNREDISLGVHTDDTAMAKCLAESILSNNLQLNGMDCRFRYVLWKNLGYCNGWPNNRTFGCGGNISESIRNFQHDQKPFVPEGNQDINGNGSVMRLAPCAIVNVKTSVQDNLRMCFDQSRTTHNGREASDCCKLLGHILREAIRFQGPSEDEKENTILRKQFILDSLPYWADSPALSLCHSVVSLARSEIEPLKDLQNFPNDFNKKITDRNWNWKVNKITLEDLSPTRLFLNREYYGSYVMDCMFLAFHIFYSTNSLHEALTMSCNMGGDCDSFGAVVGQICGAVYGDTQFDDLLQLYEEKPKSFDHYYTPYLAYRLYQRFPQGGTHCYISVIEVYVI